jgi:hypothetical protein
MHVQRLMGLESGKQAVIHEIVTLLPSFSLASLEAMEQELRHQIAESCESAPGPALRFVAVDSDHESTPPPGQAIHPAWLRRPT